MKKKDTFITLTVAEIFDLAKAAQLIPWKSKLKDALESDEDADTEYTIIERKGGIEILDDDKTPHKYAHGAFLAEYPEEGTWPLGEELPPA